MGTTKYDERFECEYGAEVPQGDGDCFTVAIEVARRYDGFYDDIAVCHGEPLGTGGEALGIRFPHAWVEFSRGASDYFVIDKSNGLNVVLPRDLYYAIGNIEAERVSRYTPQEATSLALEHEHYGPWQ